MDRREVIAMLTWVNQTDARVLLNEASAELWGNAMAPVRSAEAKQAVLDHYERNETACTPAGIRKRALAIRETQLAKQHALTAAPKKPNVSYDALRKRALRPEFIEAFEAGRREGNAERAFRTVLRETGGDHAAATREQNRILAGAA